MRAGAVAHALDAELGEFGNRRDTGASQNIDRGLLTVVASDRAEIGDERRADGR